MTDPAFSVMFPRAVRNNRITGKLLHLFRIIKTSNVSYFCNKAAHCLYPYPIDLHHLIYIGNLRKRLRYALYEAAISVIGKNKEFKEIHSYYRTREKNPLKKMQSVIAVACKLIRIFYTILTKGVDYDGQKMLNDIVRPEIQPAA